MSKTATVRAGLEKACKAFTERIEQRGFSRTLKMFWTRRHSLTLDFIHFHRHGSTYGAPRTASVAIRVHFGIRVLADNFVAAALNGPYSDPSILHSGRYHLRFNAETGSTFDRCVNDLDRFVAEHGEPWFQKFHSIDALLQLPDSPLKPQEKKFLLAAKDGEVNASHVAASLKIFGIKET
jgi:hypothetical protein